MRALALTFLSWLWRSPAWACAVCGGNVEESRKAFLSTTALMTAVPLIFIGSCAAFVGYRLRRAAAEQAAAGSDGASLSEPGVSSVASSAETSRV